MRVSVKELMTNFGLLSDKALKKPLIIAKNGRDRLVLLSVEEYQQMRERHQTRKPAGPCAFRTPALPGTAKTKTARRYTAGR